jgi:hypothetical protein
MKHDVVPNFPLTFKNHLIFDDLDVLAHFINVLLDYRKIKSAFEFNQCDSEVRRCDATRCNGMQREELNLQSLIQVNRIFLVAYRESMEDW